MMPLNVSDLKDPCFARGAGRINAEFIGQVDDEVTTRTISQAIKSRLLSSTQCCRMNINEGMEWYATGGVLDENERAVFI